MPITLMCQQCGKPFQTYPYDVKRRKHCSKECFFTSKIGKPSPMKGRHHTEESKRKNREAHLGRKLTKEHREKVSRGLKGIKRSEETRRKISEARRGMKFSEGHLKNLSKAHVGQKPWNKGMRGIVHFSMPEEAKRKISIARKGMKFSKETRERIRLANLKKIIPKEDTSIEKAVQNELQRRGISFKRQIVVLSVCRPDIVFPEEKLAVFCDGDYWHNRPDVKERDRKQERILMEHGWRLLRFWEHEIHQDVSHVVDEIEKHVNHNIMGIK